MGYTVKNARQVKALLGRLTNLQRQPSFKQDRQAIFRVEREILRLTGAPSVQAAQVGVDAFLATKVKIMKARASGKPGALAAALKPTRRARKSKRKPVKLSGWIGIVPGGLPETRR